MGRQNRPWALQRESAQKLRSTKKARKEKGRLASIGYNVCMRTVSVELYNRSVYFNGTFAKRRLWKYFRFRPRNYRFMPLYRDGKWDGWIKLFNYRYNSVNSGLFLALKDLIEASENIRFAIKDFRESVR